jgi:hypothetical protein
MPLLDADRRGGASTPGNEIGWRPGRRLLLLAFDVGDRVSHGPDLLGVFIGNLKLKGFFKSHHKLDDIQRVRTQIVDE